MGFIKKTATKTVSGYIKWQEYEETRHILHDVIMRVVLKAFCSFFDHAAVRIRRKP